MRAPSSREQDEVWGGRKEVIADPDAKRWLDAMVSKGRLGLTKFVDLTATAPAKIYNLHPRKGSIAVGADADIAIWDPAREVTLSDAMMHDLTGYTPYAGRTLRGWPCCRGQ